MAPCYCARPCLRQKSAGSAAGNHPGWQLVSGHCEVADEIKECSPDELRRVLREQAGIDLAALAPAQGGESKSTFWATDRAGTVSVLKVMPGAAQEAAGHLRTLDSVLARLRDRGYPAPRFRAIGRVPGLAFWVQQRMPGAALDLRPGRTGSRGAGPAPARPAQSERRPGRPGHRHPRMAGPAHPDADKRRRRYCLHSTLQASPAARDLLPVLRRIGYRCCPAIPAGEDFVHYDFTPANLLSDGTAITGLIDINPPALAGDRAFDWPPCCSTCTTTGTSAVSCGPGSWTWPAPFRPAPTSPTWCCGKSTGRCVTTQQPPPPGTTCAWPESSPPTSNPARPAAVRHWRAIR